MHFHVQIFLLGLHVQLQIELWVIHERLKEQVLPVAAHFSNWSSDWSAAWVKSGLSGMTVLPMTNRAVWLEPFRSIRAFGAWPYVSALGICIDMGKATEMFVPRWVTESK